MGINRLTVLEAFTNPDDLCLYVARDKQRGKFAIGITRGPGHKFKLMITSEPVIESRDKALAAMREILELAVTHGEESAKNPNDLMAQIFNPGNLPVEAFAVLKRERVEQCMELLKTQDTVETWNLPKTEAV